MCCFAEDSLRVGGERGFNADHFHIWHLQFNSRRDAANESAATYGDKHHAHFGQVFENL